MNRPGEAGIPGPDPASAPSGVLVIQPGLATFQDGGRPGYRAWGVPVGGAFDRESLALANTLVGNPPGTAALELALIGGTFEALGPLALALAGAPMTARVEPRSGADRALVIPQSFGLAPGDRLVIGGSSRGARAYLAVRGGWEAPAVLGSRSHEERIAAGTVIAARSAPHWPSRRPAGWAVADPEDGPIRVLAADPAVIDPDAIYRVESRSDRMGLRLEGPAIAVDSPPERLSEPVTPGTIQVAGGQWIVLGVACGTMGGYPVVGQVISADLDRLGQARPGARLRFAAVSLAEARRLDRDRRLDQARRFACLAAAVSDGPWPEVGG